MKLPISPKSLLTNAVRVCALAAFLFLGISVAHTKKPSECMDRNIILRSLFNSGFAYVGTFIDEKAVVFQMYVDHRRGRWVFIGVTDTMKYCVIARGYEMTLAVDRGA